MSASSCWTWASRCIAIEKAAEQGRPVSVVCVGVVSDRNDARTVAAGTRALKEAVVLTRADGKRCWAELTLLPLVEQQSGKTQGTQGVLRDITERRITEAIRDVLARIHAVADTDTTILICGRCTYEKQLREK